MTVITKDDNINKKDEEKTKTSEAKDEEKTRTNEACKNEKKGMGRILKPLVFLLVLIFGFELYQRDEQKKPKETINVNIEEKTSENIILTQDNSQTECERIESTGHSEYNKEEINNVDENVSIPRDEENPINETDTTLKNAIINDNNTLVITSTNSDKEHNTRIIPDTVNLSKNIEPNNKLEDQNAVIPNNATKEDSKKLNLENQKLDSAHNTLENDNNINHVSNINNVPQDSSVINHFAEKPKDFEACPIIEEKVPINDAVIDQKIKLEIEMNKNYVPNDKKHAQVVLNAINKKVSGQKDGENTNEIFKPNIDKKDLNRKKTTTNRGTTSTNKTANIKVKQNEPNNSNSINSNIKKYVPNKGPNDRSTQTFKLHKNINDDTQVNTKGKAFTTSVNNKKNTSKILKNVGKDVKAEEKISDKFKGWSLFDLKRSSF